MKKYKILTIFVAAITLFGCNEHPVKSIEFTETSLILSAGDKYQIEAKMLPLEAQIYNSISWSSSDRSVAVVDGRGVVTAIYSGTCTITASVGKVKARCEVTVREIDFQMNFTKAVAYFYGDAYNAALNTCLLGFYSDGYNIDPMGNVTGAGYFFNAELNYSLSDTLPPNGTYFAKEQPENFSFLTGNIVEENGNNYVTGTYFGLSSLGGTGVILLKDGNFKVQNNVFSGNFIGEKNENVKINYSGDILLIDKTLSPLDTINFDLQNATQTVQNLGDIYGCGLAVFCVNFSNSTQNLRVEFLAPLSAAQLPTGEYQLNNSQSVFSLAPSDLANSRGTIFVENSLPKAILHGSAKVEQGKISVYFVTEDWQIITGSK
ncbi:MAG: Ig-like domain-containing protein [Prevotellaceae bacterium]|nr:Ig-like domain-containing protein [Prevotellaceae bacterium]